MDRGKYGPPLENRSAKTRNSRFILARGLIPTIDLLSNTSKRKLFHKLEIVGTEHFDYDFVENSSTYLVLDQASGHPSISLEVLSIFIEVRD